MTRVVVLPADESACGYYRMRLPAGAVKVARPDWTVEVYKPGDVKLGGGYDGSLWQIHGIPDPLGIDLMVMQRTGTKLQNGLISWATQNGIAVIVDSDDAMWCIDRENIAWKGWNSDGVHWRWLDEASRTADLTTVTTKKLADRYGKHGRVEVLPNCVPSELPGSSFSPTMINSIRADFDPTTTIGWAGFTGTHPGDLSVVGDAVARVVEDTGCLVRGIGDAGNMATELGIKAIHELKPVPIGAMYYTALTSLDIGLVPLKDTPFNRGKSYLKALEYAGAGVAVVASPTPANRELAKTVPIFLADSPQEWYDSILYLINDPNLRQMMADQARAAVFEHHTYEANAEHWATAWERAITRRARMSA